MIRRTLAALAVLALAAVTIGLTEARAEKPQPPDQSRQCEALRAAAQRANQRYEEALATLGPEHPAVAGLLEASNRIAAQRDRQGCDTVRL